MVYAGEVGHGAVVDGRALDLVPLVLDDHLVHADAQRHECARAAPRPQVEPAVHLAAAGANHLHGNLPGIDVVLEELDLEVSLRARQHGAVSAS